MSLQANKLPEDAAKTRANPVGAVLTANWHSQHTSFAAKAAPTGLAPAWRLVGRGTVLATGSAINHKEFKFFEHFARPVGAASAAKYPRLHKDFVWHRRLPESRP